MLLLLTSLATAVPAAPADAATIHAKEAESAVVPFELHQGRIFVRAYVNGKGPYRFGFDTGASGIGRADRRLTKALALPRAGQTMNSDGVVAVSTDAVVVDSLQLGSVTKRNARLPSRDYNPSLKPGNAAMMGIIARDFFADLLVTIDYPARTIRFEKGALDPKSAGVVRYGPSFAVPVCFGTFCHPGKIDTGSNRGLVLPKAVTDKVATGAPKLIGQAHRTNSSVSLYEVQLRGPVQVAGVSAMVSKALYAEPSTDTVNVGSDFLKDYVLTIDSRNSLLRIAKP